MTVATLWTLRLLLVLLALLSVLVEVAFLPQLGQSMVEVFPETEPLLVPGLIWGILVIACGQAVLLIVWKLLSLVRRDRLFSESAFPWIRAIIGFSLGALAIVVVGFIAANAMGYTPPLVMYGLIGLALLCLAFALIMRTMLGLLRRATHLNDEMKEVV
ncbi:DUF2975 domain-containing protein [Microbacterium oxydans]|uniref:DUF2975 domain-containing protein n=1 Tax=Microbacterium oxydans TaxID=82380 RepID=UPI000F8FA72C|nr:DUF2975 domain-containing protein [Microbacterium oxydans]AZS46128.1 hypothetical protein CVS53_00795 [Microbacterium oxydans]